MSTNNEELKSEELENIEKENEEILEQAEIAEEKSELELLQEKNQQLELELQTTKNAYYKAYADLENTKKRLIQDAQMARKYRIQDFMNQILPVLDTLERSLTLQSEDAEFQKLHTGIKMMQEQLLHALKEEGVEEIEANGEFDPTFHQALLTEKVEGTKPNQILEVLQKGYKLKDRILRASLVKVSE